MVILVLQWVVLEDAVRGGWLSREALSQPVYGTPFAELVSRSPALHADVPGGHGSRCHALCCDAVPCLVDLLQGRWVNRDEPGLGSWRGCWQSHRAVHRWQRFDLSKDLTI